jgi:hypothetical protein
MISELIHSKIKRFTEAIDKGKVSTSFAKEMLTDFNTWITAYESEFEQKELDAYKANIDLMDKDEFIVRLLQLLVLAGYSKAISTMTIMDKNAFNECVDFLLNCKDRWNGNNIYVISTLLENAKLEGKEITDMVQLVNYARGI